MENEHQQSVQFLGQKEVTLAVFNKISHVNHISKELLLKIHQSLWEFPLQYPMFKTTLTFVLITMLISH